jgi:ATP-dependent Lon protease
MTDDFTIDSPETQQAGKGNQLMLPDQMLPDVIHLVPVSTRPFFPAQIQPVVVDTKPW